MCLVRANSKAIHKKAKFNLKKFKFQRVRFIGNIIKQKQHLTRVKYFFILSEY